MKENEISFCAQLAKAIARQFGPNCEVVVHDLCGAEPEHSIVAIENGHISGRRVGDGPSHVVWEALKADPGKLEDRLAYLTRTEDGKILKSSTVFLRDADGNVNGVFSINYDITMMKAMEDQLRAFTETETSGAEPETITHNVNDLLEATLKRLRPIAQQKNVELVLESFRPVLAELDKTKFTLAISNLVENAIKYNNQDGWVKVSLNADHKFFYVKVADNGIGIPEEAQEHVFERFYRVDKARSRAAGGTGLGLAITRSIVYSHHGAIKLYSRENEGTTFTVRIPLIYIA